MNLTALFEKVVGTQRQFQVDFGGLARQIADEKFPDPELIARVLQDSGKTVEDLRQAVERIEERRGLRRIIDQAVSLEAGRSAIRKHLAEADRELAAAEQRHRETTEPLYWELDRMAQVGREAEAARRRLSDTCTDAELLGALSDVNAERQALASRRGELARSCQELRNAAARALDEAAVTRSDGDGQHLRGRHKQFLAQAKEQERELARVEKRIAHLDEQEHGLREKMLQP